MYLISPPKRWRIVDDQVVFQKPIAGAGSFEFVVGEDLKGQMKAPVEFILPLFGVRLVVAIK